MVDGLKVVSRIRRWFAHFSPARARRRSSAGRRRPSRREILILSMAKSGSTICYQIIKESLPQDAVSFFEPATCQPEDPGALRAKFVVSKVLFTPSNGLDHYGPQACGFFNKRIYLQRDPRDLLVSALLYFPFHLAITSDFWRFAQFVSALRAKEKEPGSVSLVDLFKFDLDGYYVQRHNECPRLPSVESFLTTLQFSQDVARMHGSEAFRLRYEDLVDRRLGPLEEYLGFPLAAVDRVDPQHKRVGARRPTAIGATGSCARTLPTSGPGWRNTCVPPAMRTTGNCRSAPWSLPSTPAAT